MPSQLSGRAGGFSGGSGLMMSKISYNKKSNLVTLRYKGHVDVKVAEELHQHFQILIPQCKPGFKILVDLSSVDEISRDVIPFITRIMDLCNQHGVSQVARVIPDPDKDIGFNILSVFHYDKGIKVVNYKSLDQVRC